MDVLLDALIDSLKMLPFLFAAYLMIEYIERRQGERIECCAGGRRALGFVPVPGCVPQCGFFGHTRTFGAGITLHAEAVCHQRRGRALLLAPEQWRGRRRCWA